MMRSWTDRADRDLFFAILSRKQLGVISGAEWAAIGRDMRARGYAFTNEGCRQHFQVLRRGMTPGGGGDSVVGSGSGITGDPAQNPITRRPGRKGGSQRGGRRSEEVAVEERTVVEDQTDEAVNAGSSVVSEQASGLQGGHEGHEGHDEGQKHGLDAVEDGESRKRRRTDEEEGFVVNEGTRELPSEQTVEDTAA